MSTISTLKLSRAVTKNLISHDIDSPTTATFLKIPLFQLLSLRVSKPGKTKDGAAEPAAVCLKMSVDDFVAAFTEADHSFITDPSTIPVGSIVKGLGDKKITPHTEDTDSQPPLVDAEVIFAPTTSTSDSSPTPTPTPTTDTDLVDAEVIFTSSASSSDEPILDEEKMRFLRDEKLGSTMRSKKLKAQFTTWGISPANMPKACAEFRKWKKTEDTIQAASASETAPSPSELPIPSSEPPIPSHDDADPDIISDDEEGTDYPGDAIGLKVPPLQAKIKLIIDDYGFSGPMKTFLYDLVGTEPQDAIDSYYSEIGLASSHPTSDYNQKIQNIVNDSGYEGDLKKFFDDILICGPDKAIEELYTSCL